MIVGLGSLGFPAMQHLAMSGVHRWVLVDFDTYEEDNLVKHVGMRSDLGRLKIDVAKALKWYARLRLGEQIKSCVEDKGYCYFRAEL